MRMLQKRSSISRYQNRTFETCNLLSSNKELFICNILKDNKIREKGQLKPLKDSSKIKTIHESLIFMQKVCQNVVNNLTINATLNAQKNKNNSFRWSMIFQLIYLISLFHKMSLTSRIMFRVVNCSSSGSTDRS